MSATCLRPTYVAIDTPVARKKDKQLDWQVYDKPGHPIACTGPAASEGCGAALRRLAEENRPSVLTYDARSVCSFTKWPPFHIAC